MKIPKNPELRLNWSESTWVQIRTGHYVFFFFFLVLKLESLLVCAEKVSSSSVFTKLALSSPPELEGRERRREGRGSV